jgi:phage-related tail fiber protein
MADFYTLLTNAGIAYETACKAAGVPIKLAQISVGDGNGAVYNPDATAKALKREVWRGPLNALFQDEKNPSWLLAEVTIPAEVGGWYVREAGLWTDTGILYAIVKYPESFKPVLATSGSGKEFYIRSIFETSNAAIVTLLIDDTVVKATRAWVMGYIADELAKLDAKQSVRVATTTNINLSAAQTIDGVAVVAGDRVLVKNQAAAKDNGLYVVANAAWVRAKDADSSAKVTSAMTVSVEQGGTLADTIWQLVTDGVIVLGSTPLAFQNVTQGFAPINSPVLINPTANTPVRFDNSKSLATTEFVKQSAGNYVGVRSIIAAAQLTVADIGWTYGVGGNTGYTVTLPDVAGVQDGSVIAMHCRNNGTVVVASKTGQQISPQGAYLSSITMMAGESASFVKEGLVWCVYGTVALKYSAQFSASTGVNGFERKPSGLIEQWGAGVSDSSGNLYVTFPISFPEGMRNIVAMHVGAAGAIVICVGATATKQGVTLRIQQGTNGAPGEWLIYWRAIGV